MSETHFHFDGNGKIELDASVPLIKVSLQKQTREHIESWYQHMERLYTEWRGDKVIRVFLNAKDSNITPYFRERMMALRTKAQIDDQPTRTAALLRPEDRTELQVLANLTVMGSSQRLRIFMEEGEAMAWLLKGEADA